MPSPPLSEWRTALAAGILPAMTARRRLNDPSRVGRPTPHSTADLEVLADVGRRLAGSLELSALLSRASSFIVPRLADWYVLTLRQPDGRLATLAFDHADPSRRIALTNLVSGGTFKLPSLSTLAGASDFEPLGIGSLICTPLGSGADTVGVLLLARCERDAYDAASVQLLAEIGRRLGLAIANANRYEAAQEQLHQMYECLAVAAHELRTPAAALSGYAQLCLRQYAQGTILPPERVHEVLRQIDSQATRMAAMVDRLLDAASVDAGKLSVQPAEADMRDLVSTVVSLARSAAPDRTISWRASRGIPVKVDPLRIEQVLSNLIDNALKFSPQDAPVQISLRTRRPDRLVLSIRDHGVGVPADLRAHIFDRFAQAHRHQLPGGLGLGLYLSRHIVEQHGGRLTADYPRDGGAKFIVELPILTAEPIASAHGIEGPDTRGERTYDTARAQSDWRSGSHTRRPTGKLRPPRLNRTPGIPGAVPASIPA
jgi:signal transduction histidine kinase